MNEVLAIALAGHREALRNRVTVVVGAFAAVLILLTSMVLSVTIFSLDRIVTDFGLGVMSLLLTGLALFMSVGMLSREIERKTVFLVMSRPISRGHFVLGRYLGMLGTLTMIEFVMVGLYASQLLFFSVPWSEAVTASLVGLWLELCLISALGVLFSSFSGPLTSTISVLALYLLGHWSADAYALSTSTDSAAISALMRAAYYALPNLDRLDFKPQAAYASPISGEEWLRALATGAAWTAAFLAGAVLVFRKRDFK